MSTKQASSAARKRRLLVIAGAGSVVDFGMPSVSCVNQICKNAAKQWFSLANDASNNLYGYMYDEVTRYMSAHLGRTPNFEDILYTLYVLGSTSPASRSTSALGAFVTRRRFPDVVYITTPKAVDDDVLRHLSQHLVDSLLDDFRTRCRERSRNLTKLEDFFSALCDEFDVAVVTTNYDDLIYRAVPPAGRETGFSPDDGSFRLDRILHRPRWPCILHLHGSVHFERRADERHRIFWESDLARCQQNFVGGYPGRTIEGHEFPTTSIIAGYGKTEQIQHLPFRMYYSELDRLIHESDAALFLGYGFGDTHVNEAFADYRDSRDRRVVIIDRAEDETMTASTASKRVGCSVTACRAMKVFKTPPYQMRAGSSTSARPSNLKRLRDAMEFERSIQSNCHLALWYNGMCVACENPTKVLNELS